MDKKLVLLVIAIIIVVLIIVVLHQDDDNHRSHHSVGGSNGDFNMYVFGDSFSTTGNNVFIYGTNSSYRPNGRYSDKLTNSDYLAAAYGLEAYNAYDPDFKGFRKPKGNLLNLAVGGWTTENYLNGDNDKPGEIPKFLEIMSTKKIKFDPERDVIMFSSCNANDVFSALGYNHNTNSWVFDTPTLLSMHLNLKAIISNLYDFGVRHLILLDASNYIRVAPAIVINNDHHMTESARNIGSTLHKDIVTQLSSHALKAWPALDLLISDLGVPLEKLLFNYKEYGIREPTASDPTASLPLASNIPKAIFPWKASVTDAFYLSDYGKLGLKDQLPERDTYNAAFWDDLHPTSHFHSIIVEKFFLPLLARKGYQKKLPIENYLNRLPTISASYPMIPVTANRVKTTPKDLTRKIKVYP